MRTAGRFEAKTAHVDALIQYGAGDISSLGGAATKTLNAKGDVSFNVGAGVAAKFIIDLSGLLRRTGEVPFLQEQFGTAASVAGPTTVANTSDPDANIGPPPQTGSLSITPLTGFFPKGIKITDYIVHYQITTNPLSLHTSGLSKTVMPTPGTPAALVVTDIVANAANGLATAVNANPQSTTISVASPTFSVTDLAQLIIEIDATTPAGGSYRLYGVTIHAQFNYN